MTFSQSTHMPIANDKNQTHMSGSMIANTMYAYMSKIHIETCHITHPLFTNKTCATLILIPSQNEAGPAYGAVVIELLESMFRLMKRPYFENGRSFRKWSR